MTRRSDYRRTIPRDLFNEAKLLKCYGQLYLNLERMGLHECLHHDGEPFEVYQDDSDGGLYLANVELIINGQQPVLWCPLNARSTYPMLTYGMDDESAIHVFHQDDGAFTPDFKSLIARLNGSAS